MFGHAATIDALNNLSDETTRVELSDLAVNTIRDHFAKMGYPASSAAVMMNQELRRIRAAGTPLTGAGFIPYLRSRRVGSEFRLSRTARAAVFCQLACKIAR